MPEVISTSLPAKANYNTLNTAILNLAIASAYFLVGLFCLEITLPFSKISTIWPPSGIALASVLLYGVRVCSGIFIGSFCISAWSYGFDIQYFSIYLITAAAITVFTITASWLVKKYSGYPNELIADKKILLFFLLAGPISCLIPATIGISALLFFKLITVSETGLNWFSWWAGDTIGVLIFTPLLLTFFSRNSKLWKRRRYSLGLPLIAAFVIILCFLFYFLKFETYRYQNIFLHKSLTATNKLEARINNHIQFIHSVHDFYKSSKVVEKHELEQFTHSFLYKFEENISIAFLKSSSGKNNITTNSFIPQYNLYKDDFITPSNYIVPAKLLNDIAASHSQEAISSAYLKFHKNIINLFIPLYESTKNYEIKLKGIIVNTLSLPEIINFALEKSSLKLSIHNLENKSAVFIDKNITAQHSVLEQSLQLANQDWKLTYYLDLNLLYSKTQGAIWWVLSSVLVFSGLISMGLLLLTGRNLRTEIIVNQRTQELHSANRAKNQFLANISHELRTPLNGILGFSQLLQEKSYLNAEDKKQIKIIHHCGNHLLTMINDIDDISKLASYKIKIDTESFNFNDFIEDIIYLFSLKADEKNLSFSVFKQPISKLVYTDKKRLNQIISNLLDNAIKFTDKGNVTLKIDHQNEQLSIKISDSGCGISKTHQDNIFTPFSQINSNNFSEEGIGLGLAICAELVNLMKGTLSVDSHIGHGSIFKVSLPLPYAQVDDKSLPTTALKSKTHQAHILIAEDNEINIMLLSHILQGLDCTFDIADNGVKALNLLSTRQYQLALIDLNMPVMDGLELIQLLRKKGMNTPAIAISAYADEDKIAMALTLGFNDYLTKPINEHQLKKQIDNYT